MTRWMKAGRTSEAIVRDREARLSALALRVWLIVLTLLALSAESSPAPSAKPPQGEVCAVTLNIWHDQEDWPARLAVMLGALRELDPDVILLQEVLQKEGLPNQAQTLADSLDYGFVFASVDTPGAPKRYGNAILSPHRILETHEMELEPLDDYRVAAHAHLDLLGRSLHVYVTHLHHTKEGSDIRARQIEHLLHFIDDTRGAEALLLGGDFNAPPDARELLPIRDRLIDAYAAVHPEKTGVLVTTLNTRKGHLPRRIDYLFTDPGRLEPVACEVFLDVPTPEGVWASDHFGVWARFRWSQ
jgi:endonuclease/exonuclease/phosphatase family metal-dependent hydrolase